MNPAPGDGAGPLEVVVHDLEQARGALEAAAALGVPVRLRSAPDAAGYAGVGYLQALGQAVGHELAIDCGDDAGLVMAALRAGARELVFAGDAATAAKLADMAAQVGAIVRHEPEPREVVPPRPAEDAGLCLRRWLARRAAGHS